MLFFPTIIVLFVAYLDYGENAKIIAKPCPHRSTTRSLHVSNPPMKSLNLSCSTPFMITQEIFLYLILNL